MRSAHLVTRLECLRVRGTTLIRGLAVLAAIAAANSAWGVGLVYVDADDGFVSGQPNLSPVSAIDPLTSAVDERWGFRALGSSVSIFESGTTANPGAENSPELTMTLDNADGLVTNASYDIYVVYWSAVGQNWSIRGGLSPGNHTLFNREPVGFLPTAVSGTTAGSAIWATPPTLTTEADRVMLMGKVGTATATGGQINVFIDDLPTSGFPESAGGNAFFYRSWLDGVAFVEAGTSLHLTATIDRGNGKIEIKNPTGQSVQVVSYSINSAAGALDPNAWLSISDNYDGDDGSEFDSHVWNVTAPTMPFPAAATTLSEAEDPAGANSGGALTASGLNLGNAWIRTPIQDVQISLTLANASVVTLTPTYTGTAIAAGDLNADGFVTLADFGILRTNMHTDVTALTQAQAYKLGDMVGGGRAIDYDDFIAFRTAYNAAHGAGAFEAAMSIPEPAGMLLLAIGVALLSMTTCRQRFPAFILPVRARSYCEMLRPRFFIMLCTVTVLFAWSGKSNAQLVTGWGLDTTLANATLTEGAPGSFGVTTPTANAGPRALLASPIDFSDVGDVIRLSGTATIANALGNQQFRFGLYNTNGHATGTLAGGVWTGADPAGWLGYMVQVGGGGGSDAVKGRTGAGAGVWLSNTDAYDVGFGPGGAASPPANTPYNFTLTLRRTGATSVRTDYSFVGGAVTRSGTFTDNNLGASASISSFNSVGYLLNPGTGGGQFSNVTVEVPKELRLRVNRLNGAVSIVNTTDVPFSINYYEIRSTGGSLNPSGWVSLDDQEGTDPVGTGWDETGGSSANILSELNFQGMTTFAPSASAQLGNAFNVGGAEDWTFSYGIFGQTSLQSAFVEFFTPTPVPGDYNNNYVVDAADYALWRNGGPLQNDPTPGVQPADYDFWRARFGNTSAVGFGGGADSLASALAVPEPATAALFVICGVLALGKRRHGRAGNSRMAKMSYFG